MFELSGKYNTAKIYTDNADNATISQVTNLLNQESSSGSVIRIMPDCHAGAGCVIGTTMTIRDKVIPGLVGVDIGCGMLTIRLKEKRVDLPNLDSVIRKFVPSGPNIHEEAKNPSEKISAGELQCFGKTGCKVSELIFDRSLGTLGGGNHFIEVDKDEEGSLFLVIHTGSRRSGKDVAEYYQQKAFDELNMSGRTFKEEEKKQREAFIRNMKAAGRQRELKEALSKWKPDIEKPAESVPYEFAYCEGQMLLDYLHDMEVMQRYAWINREMIAKLILKNAKLHAEDSFQTVHNYIDTNDMILRKGSISAKKDELILIPMNMRDGSLICRGRGNQDWNYSAPHGAGRLMSRSQAKESIGMDAFRKSMDGIYTTSVSRATLDESPMAYKPMEEIMANIQETAEIIKVIKPIYNYKAGDESD